MQLKMINYLIIDQKRQKIVNLKTNNFLLFYVYYNLNKELITMSEKYNHANFF